MSQHERSGVRTAPRLRSRLIAMAALLVLAAGVAACDQRGPDPTEASVTAELGPFTYATTTVPVQTGKFGGGTIYYPTGTTQRVGAVAVVPGFISDQSSMSWYGPRLASQGFVVFTIDTLSGFDNPSQRATQLREALVYLTTNAAVPAAVRDRTDVNRLAVLGWSMGGGGAVESAKLATPALPPLRAVVAVAPWENTTSGFSTITVPTLVVACEADTVAPVASHAEPIYNALSAASMEKELVEIDNGDHFCVTTGNNTAGHKAAIARQVISWLKRWVDGDGRYTPFLCPPPLGGVVSRSFSTCPLGS
jgi:dienelactone hydrolase